MLDDRMVHTAARPVISTRCLLAGIVLRAAIYAVSIGSNDIRTWERFGQLVHEFGLAGAYARDSLLNHPPLPCLLALLSLHLSTWSGVAFPYIFKLLPMLADLGTLALVALYVKKARGFSTSACLYALSVPAILISAYHGNTDSICVFLVMVSLCCVEIWRKPALAGLSLAAATNIKILPLLLVPLVAAALPRKREIVRFGACFAVGMLPIALMSLLADSFFKNVIGYRPVIEPWGIQYFLYAINSGLTLAYSALGRFIVVCCVLVLAVLQWKYRRLSCVEMISVGTSLLLVLAPGFGIQYLIYVAPFIVITSPMLGLSFNIVGGLFTFLVYHEFLIYAFPLASYHHVPIRNLTMGVFTWGVLAWSLCQTARRLIVKSHPLTRLS